MVDLAAAQQLPVVDLHTAMMAQPQWQSLLCDGLHLNDAGQAFVLAAMSGVLDRAAPHLAPGPSPFRRCVTIFCTGAMQNACYCTPEAHRLNFSARHRLYGRGDDDGLSGLEGDRRGRPERLHRRAPRPAAGVAA